MTMTLDIGSHPSPSIEETVPSLDAVPDFHLGTRLDTIVLQPSGCLDRHTSSAFRQVLEDSLHQAADGVIVDLLWVEFTDQYGLAALIAGLQQATALGKLLSFESMDASTRVALEAERERQRDLNFGAWNDLFEQDLERFLDSSR